MAKKPTINDPELKFLKLVSGSPQQMIHSKLISEIVHCLYKSGWKRINYDHINTTIPKKEIPLRYGHNRGDIAVALGPHLMALIEIEIVECAQKLEE